MRVPLSWLKEYVSLDGIAVQELAERLTIAGLEVAAIEYIGVPGSATSDHLVWDRETIRVGEIVAVEPHPNADRLRLVTVVYGADEPKTVVTGAPNVVPGQKVAYATTGAIVLNGYSEEREQVKLEPKKLRGIRSEGMVLSERELGLSDEHEGILELPADAPTGTPLQDYLGDVVLEIELTPNLGRADSMLGVAREVAALFDRPLSLPALDFEAGGAPASEAVQIEIEVPEGNPRFTATLIRNVTIGPSPAWMQRRLRLVGMRPINNIVDITNYVMMELGQPLHAFDYDRLVERARRIGEQVPTLITRRAREGERLRTLDDIERTLDPADILVTDRAGILSIAGVMGGAETEVSDETTNVLLEAAAWDFISIRRTARRHLLFSEAAYRFSRDVHPAMALRGNVRGAGLMGQLAGGQVAAGVVDVYPTPVTPVQIELTASTVNRSLGTDLSLGQIAGYLKRLEFEVEQEADRLQVTVPDHRRDVEIPVDLVEEVGRIHGLDQLPMTLLADLLPPLREEDRARLIEERIRDLLVGAGLTETISYALGAPEQEAALVAQATSEEAPKGAFVCLANPISHDRSVMRRTLLVSAIETLQTNLRHRERVAIFEIGKAYLPQAGELLPEEQGRLVIAMTGPLRTDSWLEGDREEIDFYALKGVVEEMISHLYLAGRVSYEVAIHPAFQPGRAASVKLDGKVIGVLGELHPQVRRANDLPDQRIALTELDLDALVAAVPSAFRVEPIARFPAVVQDLAVVVDEAMPAGEVERVIREAGGERITRIELFDVYRGKSIAEGKKSLAYSLQYIDPERTLTDQEVAIYHGAITAALRERLDAQIRGEDL